MEDDFIIPVEGFDAEMNQAIDEARASIGQFFDAFQNPQPNQTAFLIKARFSDGDTIEHIWLADLDFSTNPASGTVANEPAIKTLRYLDRATFTPEQLSDWMYHEDGKLVGGFTTRLLQKMKPQ